MNPDNTKPLADRRTPARQRARNEHAAARRIARATQPRRAPIMDIREIAEWEGGYSERRPTGPGVHGRK